MKFTIQIRIEDEQGNINIEDIIQLDRQGDANNAIG